MMYKKILIIVALLVAMAANAHRTDMSTTMLVEKENGAWVLQVSGSLTAFQQEIRTHFAKTPYKTPEQFQQMVLEHLKNNIHIRFNNTAITFGKGAVKLGHETKAVFEVFGIPSEIESAHVTNTAFKDIQRNESVLVVLKEGFNKDRFVLNSDNNHTLVLKAQGNEFIKMSKSKASLFSSDTSMYIGFGVILVLSMFGIFKLFKPEKIVLI